MIEDAGPFGLIVLGVILVVCIVVWIKNALGLSEMLTGHLYMFYFFGSHSAYEIMNEIDPGAYTVTAVYHDLYELKSMGLIERDPDYDDVGAGRYGYSFTMTDLGEKVYKKYAKRHGMDFYEDDTTVIGGGPNRERRPS